MQIAIIGAGFSPEEADRLRRSLATFKNVGTIHTFRERFLEGMAANGYDADFAERCFSQIEGFGSYGFPESHAASFALLVYASAWLKCHHPAVFACALLNSQPMGFYAPAQIVRDARAHGVEVRPVCVNASYWDNVLEPDGRGGLALRLGFRQIKGMRAGRRRLDRRGPRQRLPRRRRGLAAGRARRRGCSRGWPRPTPSPASGSTGATALWQVAALGGDAPLPLFAGHRGRTDARPVPLPPMTLGEEIVADYTALRLTLRAHPMALLRPRLDALCAQPTGARRSARRCEAPGDGTGRAQCSEGQSLICTSQGRAFTEIVNSTGGRDRQESDPEDAHGEKPPILFLHGAFAGPEVWTRFVAPWFAARGHQVAAPRLPAPAARRAAARLRAPGARPPPTPRRAAGGRRPFARRARRPAPRGPAPGRRRRARLLARALRPRPVALAALGRARRTCSRACWSPRPAAGCCSAARRSRRALFTEDTPDAWIAEVAGASTRRARWRCSTALTWDLPAWFLVRRAADARGARRPRRLRAGHRPLGDRARLRRRDRARPRRRATACRSTRTGRASPGGSTPGSTSGGSAAARVAAAPADRRRCQWQQLRGCRAGRFRVEIG